MIVSIRIIHRWSSSLGSKLGQTSPATNSRELNNMNPSWVNETRGFKPWILSIVLLYAALLNWRPIFETIDRKSTVGSALVFVLIFSMNWRKNSRTKFWLPFATIIKFKVVSHVYWNFSPSVRQTITPILLWTSTFSPILSYCLECGNKKELLSVFHSPFSVSLKHTHWVLPTR